MLAFMATCGLSVNAADKVVGERYTSIGDLEGQKFAIVNETDAKAFYGSGYQNLGYADYSTAMASSNAATSFRLVPASGSDVAGYYYFQAVKPDGTDYFFNEGGYLNAQPAATGWCCFILGLNNQNGQDFLNGAVWQIIEENGKFAIKNIGTQKYLKDAGNANQENPTYFTFCTLIDDPVPAIKDKYNALLEKYREIYPSLTHDVSLSSLETVEAVQGAIDELISIFGNSLANSTNLTSLITNPSFESNFTGWTNNGMATQNNNSFGGKVGTNYCEAWQPSGTKSVSQSLTLPQGVYRLSANGLARLVTSAKLYAGSSEKAITIADASNKYDVKIYVSNGGDVTIGFEGVGTGEATSWLCVDNFELTYIQNSDMTDAEFAEYVAYQNALDNYNEALADAQDLSGRIPTAAYVPVQQVIDQNTLTSGTTDDYNNAASAINDATTDAQVFVDPYAEYLETKNNTIAMKDADTYIGADAKTTLEEAISTAATNVEAATTVTAIDIETATLKAAANTFVKSVTIKADKRLDITCLLTNPHFNRGGSDNATGWTIESGSVGERRASTHNFEAWHRTFNLSQTIANLPVGTYKVTLQGFARHDGSDINKTNLYCGTSNQKIKDINDEYSTSSLISGKPNMGDNMGESVSDGKYRPNGMSSSYYFFQEENPDTHQPFYTNEVEMLVSTAGNLKIGFKCETNTDWVIWDNFHIYYYGSAIAVTIDENAANSSYTEDVNNANVTLKRTIKAKGETGIWNTIFLPFSLTDTETKAAFGSDVQIATYSEVPDAGTSNSTVNFAIAEDAAIAANTPVLLRTSTAGTSYSFDGKTIKAGEAKVAGTNFDFVGTYAASTTIAEGDYFLSSNKLYRSKGTTTIKGTRAYIKAKAASEARIEKFFIDGIEATNIEGLTVAGAADGKIYNLNGQEVKAPKKGLYIQNGKKISIK